VGLLRIILIIEWRYMAISLDFTGRVVIVTGGAGSIGAAIANRFLDAGASVGVLDRNSGEINNSSTLIRGLSKSCRATGGRGLGDTIGLSKCCRGSKGRTSRPKE
jgi:NAD(P)-dependent dehydrogenase (short-subunit alcohol dehydrogenase family)